MEKEVKTVKTVAENGKNFFKRNWKKIVGGLIILGAGAALVIKGTKNSYKDGFDGQTSIADVTPDVTESDEI